MFRHNKHLPEKNHDAYPNNFHGLKALTLTFGDSHGWKPWLLSHRKLRREKAKMATPLLKKLGENNGFSQRCGRFLLRKYGSLPMMDPWDEDGYIYRSMKGWLILMVKNVGKYTSSSHGSRWHPMVGNMVCIGFGLGQVKIRNFLGRSSYLEHKNWCDDSWPRPRYLGKHLELHLDKCKG